MLMGYIDFKDLLMLFDDETTIRVNIKGEDSPWFCNKVKHLKEIVGAEWFDKYTLLYFNNITIGADFAGVDTSHVTLEMCYDDAGVLNEFTKDIEEHSEIWWTYLRLATKGEFCELYYDCIKTHMFSILNESKNEVVFKAMESGKCDEAISKMVDTVDFDQISLAGITVLGIKNAKENPTTNELYQTLLESLKESLHGVNGQQLMDLLFK